jgi:hypothetical protein
VNHYTPSACEHPALGVMYAEVKVDGKIRTVDCYVVDPRDADRINASFAEHGIDTPTVNVNGEWLWTGGIREWMTE